MIQPGNLNSSISIIRKAQASDDARIQDMVHSARLAPFDLDWRRFVVAEIGSQIVGVGQVRQHRDGSHELASIAVLPAYQSQGIGSSLIHELLREESGLVYLFCRQGLRTYYERFGFQQIPPAELPRTMRRLFRIAQWLNPLGSALLGHKIEIIGMRRSKPEATNTNPNQPSI